MALRKSSEITCYQITQLSELFLDDIKISDYFLATINYCSALVQCVVNILIILIILIHVCFVIIFHLMRTVAMETGLHVFEGL